MRPKVSIIVPVFNAGERLRICLDSLLNQTLKDIEIILVLDCPTDGSDIVAKEYAEQDGRIKIVSNPQNLNIGFSRNEGLKVASGEYIGFSDHDDYCLPQMFEIFYNKAVSSNADIVASNVGEEINGVRYETTFPTDANFQEGYLTALINGSPFKRCTCSFDNCNTIWNQIYRRSFIDESCLQFGDNRILTYEDSLFLIMAYSKAQRVEYLPETLYYHVETGANEFHSYSYRSISKVGAYLDAVLDFLENYSMTEKYAVQISSLVFQRLYTSLLNELKHKGFVATIKAYNYIKGYKRWYRYLKSAKPNIHWTTTKNIVYRVLRTASPT